MSDLVTKGRNFRELHRREGLFVIPNPWDVGSARLLAHCGFEALATTSMGRAFSCGQLDGTLTREQTLAYAREIVAATELPVSADLENGFGDAPQSVAETIRMAGAIGLAGGSIEDATGREHDPIYDLGLAKERVRAAVEAAHSLSYPFMLTARAENFLHGRRDLGDTIARLQAYQEAGADVLYAPALETREDIASLVRSVDRPVNVVMGLSGVQLSVSELAALGVKRISIGSALYRAAMGAAWRAAVEMRDEGSFAFGEAALKSKEMNAILEPYASPANSEP